MNNFEGQVTRKIPEHVMRMTEERDQLTTRLDALGHFINDSPVYKELSGMQKDLLQIQYDAMQTYSRVLHVRIEQEFAIDAENAEEE